jgi:DNA-binding transcriptional regulator GbsR (MarR family)
MPHNNSNTPRLFINLNDLNERRVDKVLSFLKSSEKPISFDTLAFALNLKKFHLAILLSRLEKQGYIKKVYCRQTSYWVAKKENVDNVEIFYGFGMKKRKSGDLNGQQKFKP